MMKRKFFLTVVLFSGILPVLRSQEPLKYQLPPEEIVQIIDAPVTPVISVSPDKLNIVIIQRPSLITIEELSEGELRLGGLRINPLNNGPSRQTLNKGFKIINIDGTNERSISGMPADPALGSPRWSPDGKMFAFVNSKQDNIELWVCDVNLLKAWKIADHLNLVAGSSFNWLSDSKRLVYSVIDPGRGLKPELNPVPEGPVVQESLGKKGQSATYQDLLKDPVDEALFEYFMKSQLVVWDGTVSTAVGSPALLTDISPSPDGNYLLVTLISRPFSYIVPYYNFPSSTQVWDMKGDLVRILHNEPLVENEPRGYDMVLPGPRYYRWRSDEPASVYWVEALDDGDYSKKMQYHDQVYILRAPFSGTPQKFIATEMRFMGIIWGKSDFALITEGLSKTRNRVVSSFNPETPQETKKKIQEYNSDDRYNNPGRFMTEQNIWGEQVLLFTSKGKSLYLTGSGASPEGDKPFVDLYDIALNKSARLWRSQAPYFETPETWLNVAKGLILTSRQSVSDVPNYFIRNIKNGKITPVTKFGNPYPQLQGIQKELVRYKRSDSLDLSFTLYLPEGFSRGKDAPLPTLLWAYPREFNDPSAAGQVSGSPFTFTRISPASALVYVTQGYAILMDASFPIVGVDGKEPNDTFVEQLVANAEAAISKAVKMGVTDPKRVAVSGHSYGAFMTANLLAHSRLFAAGIAESGAYNRTLTPFGFQNERRNYWEAPDIYNRMSPFMNADKVKDPILLIHGMADNNSGTFPIQSERLYSALKGFGATVRLVMLPNESHGYAARETILHKHWEVLKWMDRYVKERR